MKNTLLFLLALAVYSAKAQTAQTACDGKMTVTVDRMEVKGQTLELDLGLQLLEALKSSKTLDVTPLLTDGTKRVSFATVTFMGRNKMREHQRLVALGHAGDAEQVAPGYQPLGAVRYHATTGYEPWMDHARLQLRTELCNCGGSKGRQTTDSLTASLLKQGQPVQPRLAFLQPQVEQQKQRDISGEAHLQFVVNRWDIRPDLGANDRELAHIERLMDEVQQTAGITIKAVDVAGYASPEGTTSNNLRLSAHRAGAMASYIANHYRLGSSLFTSHSGGEDWNGLDSLVRRDNAVPSRDAVLRLLADEGDAATRKARLQALDGGAPYRYLLDNLYPQLRRVRVHILYHVKNFSLDEARKVYREQPRNLSLDELYRLALSYPEESAEYYDIFETAARLFPADPTANLNAAVAALKQHNTERAAHCLKRVEGTRLADTPQYHNTLGVLLLLQGDREAARQHFLRAGDLPQAQANLSNLKS